jgi:hypothetical protein
MNRTCKHLGDQRSCDIHICLGLRSERFENIGERYARAACADNVYDNGGREGTHGSTKRQADHHDGCPDAAAARHRLHALASGRRKSTSEGALE